MKDTWTKIVAAVIEYFDENVDVGAGTYCVGRYLGMYYSK